MIIPIEALIPQQTEELMELSAEEKVYQGYVLANLLSQYRDWHMAEISGRDGCIIALAREEIQTGKVWLVREDPWRLVIPEDEHHRRWCRGVYQIELEEGEAF